MKSFLIISALLIGGLVFTSCEQNLPSIENPDVHTLISLHNSSKKSVQKDIPISPHYQSEVTKAFEHFQNDLQSRNMDDFWAEHEMTQVVEAAEYFLPNENSENVYASLASNFDLTTSEYEKMFLIVEVAKIVPEVFGERNDCAVAVASYIVTVADAVFIGGPVGLAYWAVSIGFGAAGIYNGCG